MSEELFFGIFLLAVILGMGLYMKEFEKTQHNQASKVIGLGLMTLGIVIFLGADWSNLNMKG